MKFKRFFLGRKNLVLSYGFLCSIHFLCGQKYFAGKNEFGGLVGGSSYWGDLLHNYQLKRVHPSLGAFYKKNINNYFSYRFQIQYLKISADDNDSKNFQYRNLNFQSNIWEVGAMLEFNFHEFGPNTRSRRSLIDGLQTPYVFTGINAFRFNPRTLDQGGIELQPLRTENQSRRYWLIQPSIPLGVGYKRMVFSKKNRGSMIIGFEAGLRKTFTDYLDDVSNLYPNYTDLQNKRGNTSANQSHAQVQNGNAALNPKTVRGEKNLKDWYYFLGISISYRLTPMVCW